MTAAAAEPDLHATLPTPERISTARQLIELHTRVCVPEPSCHWCLRSWPCPEVRWSQRVLARGKAAGALV